MTVKRSVLTRRLVLLTVTIVVLVLLICSASFGWFIRTNDASATLGMKVLKYEVKYIDSGSYSSGTVLSPRTTSATIPLTFTDFTNSKPSGYPDGGIAPGYSGTYTFKIKNTGEIPISYSFSFSGANTFPGNLTWTIKKGTGTATALATQSGSLNANAEQAFTIAYSWPTNDNSTDNTEDTSYIALSSNNGKTKTLTLNFTINQK